MPTSTSPENSPTNNRITDDPAAGVYRVGHLIPVPADGRISRADLVDFVLGELEAPRHTHELLSIAH